MRDFGLGVLSASAVMGLALALACFAGLALGRDNAIAFGLAFLTLFPPTILLLAVVTLGLLSTMRAHRAAYFGAALALSQLGVGLAVPSLAMVLERASA